MSDTIRRWECPECGRAWLNVTPNERHADDRRAVPHGCPGVPVERVYIAVDALLSIREIPRDYLRAAIAAVTEEQR